MTTLDGIVRRGRLVSPDAVAIVDGGTSWTWQAFDEQVTRGADALRRLGIGPGDRVAGAGHSSAPYFALYYACARLGAVVCPLNYLGARDELRWVLANFEPKLVVAAPEHLDDVAATAPAGVDVRPFGEWDELRAASDPDAELPPPDPDAVHVVMYTSGTTGRPKGVCHTQRAHYLDGLQAALGYGLRRGDRYVVHAPSFHGASWDHAKIFFLVDGSIVLLPRFDPVALMEAVARNRATVIFGVPAVLRALLADQRRHEFDLSSVRLVFSGGALGATSVQAEFAAALGRTVDYLSIYGITEGGPFVTSLAPELAAVKPGSIGRPVPGVELVLRDPETGELVPPGEIGELLVRSPGLMTGYWRDPDATAAALRDGWLRTGDLARRDADGDYEIVDRLKEMIRSGGENVYAAEVERVLLEHPAVLEAAVLGLPDPRWDERVVAALVPRPGATLDEDEVRRFCRERLAAYKVPKQVELVASLPKTGIGKIAKHELRERLREPAG